MGLFDNLFGGEEGMDMGNLLEGLGGIGANFLGMGKDASGLLSAAGGLLGSVFGTDVTSRSKSMAAQNDQMMKMVTGNIDELVNKGILRKDSTGGIIKTKQDREAYETNKARQDASRSSALQGQMAQLGKTFGDTKAQMGLSGLGGSSRGVAASIMDAPYKEMMGQDSALVNEYTKALTTEYDTSAMGQLTNAVTNNMSNAYTSNTAGRRDSKLAWLQKLNNAKGTDDRLNNNLGDPISPPEVNFKIDIPPPEEPPNVLNMPNLPYSSGTMPDDETTGNVLMNALGRTPIKEIPGYTGGQQKIMQNLAPYIGFNIAQAIPGRMG